MGMDDSNLDMTHNKTDGKSTRATLLRGHWRTVAVLLNIYDIMAVNVAYFMALWLRFDLKFSEIRPDFLDSWMRFAPIYTVFCLAVFWAFRLYRSLWKYASYSELMHLIAATCVTGLFHTIAITLLFMRMPISYYMIGITLQFFFMAAIRFSYRFYILMVSQMKSDSDEARVMLIGAGNAGQSLIHDREGVLRHRRRPQQMGTLHRRHSDRRRERYDPAERR